ncbi:unnamed protein product [Brassica napus]|nr:unnamed protein product [Brassica napus]
MTNKESSEVGNLPTSPMAKRARMCEECLLGNLPTSPMAKRVRTCEECLRRPIPLFIGLTNRQLAFGFDVNYNKQLPPRLVPVPSTWSKNYVIGLYGRIGLQCYNLQKGTNFKFKRLEKHSTVRTGYLSYYITLEATDPATGSVCSFQTQFSDAGRRRFSLGARITWFTIASRIKQIPHHHTLTRRIFQLIITVETMSTQISEIEQEQLLEKLEIFKIHGRDKRRRKILRIIGKFFPARFLSLDVLKKTENFPGISALRAIYDAIPVNVRDNLQEVYFLHPGLQSRLFLATCGRFLFSGGLYGKLRYVSRVDYLWEHVRRNEIEMPEFVYDHDDDLEYRPMMDYGQESDHARVYAGAAVDSPVSSFSMRCIS